MKDDATRRQRVYWRVGATALLLTLTLGSTAQTPGAGIDRAPVAPVSATSLDAVPPAPAAPVKQPQIPLAQDFDARLFEAAAQQLVADQRIPGMAMAIVYNGRVLSARGYGITDVQAAEPVDAHTVFRLASLSKGFAGTLAGLLVNDGSIRWDSRLTQYLPEFRLRDPSAADRITVADVLSHRVGLRHHSLDRDLEQYVDYRTLTRRLSTAPLSCQPGTCYGYQNIAFSLIGDVTFAATGTFYSQAVQRRLFKPLGMNDASLGLEGIQASPRWARPHVRTRAGWVSVTPKPTYYEVAPAAGVNASASDMAQWLIAQTGHRPDVLPAPLLATLHSPLVQTPGEMRSTAWRRERLSSAGYGLGWRVYNYSGHQLVYHGGAVQGYRGAIAMLPERDFGVAVLWNGESAVPAGLLPTILDKAIGVPSGDRWLDVDFEEATLYVQSNYDTAPGENPGSNASRATASPE